MAQKVKISGFLNYYAPHAVMTNKTAPNPPPADQWGYVMGADGRVATDEYLRARAKSSYPASWESHYRDTLKWIGRRVADCNAVAEHFYKAMTGIGIDTKARLNWANWCGIKSVSKPDANLTGLPQLPGIAVFAGGSTASGITHVGFLFKKYGPGPLDWYVLESRGRNYGLVLTRIKDRSWRYWGKMDKCFEYDLDAAWTPMAAEEGYDEMVIKRGMKDTNKDGEVAAVQTVLKALGYDMGKYPDKDGNATGIDGDFGEMTELRTMDMQKRFGLPATGIWDGKTLFAGVAAASVAGNKAELEKALSRIAAAKPALEAAQKALLA